MEMEMEVKPEEGLSVMERIAAAALLLEGIADRLSSFEVRASTDRSSVLEERLREAEATIVSLRAQAGRKTSVAAASLVAKEGGVVETAALDAALASLSVEQRFAVKAGLLRGGLVG